MNNEIAGVELDEKFFKRLIGGEMWLIKETTTSDKILTEDEIVEITARRAFELQGKIQKAANKLSRQMRKTCSKHFIQVVAEWYKDIYKEAGKHQFLACYKARTIDEKTAKQLQKKMEKQKSEKKER